jgi:hypothetical protein
MLADAGLIKMYPFAGAVGFAGLIVFNGKHRYSVYK